MFRNEDEVQITRIFDRNNSNYSEQPELNLAFIQGAISHLDLVLQSRGHLFLNDVFDELDFSRTCEGASFGWLSAEGWPKPMISIWRHVEQGVFLLDFRNSERIVRYIEDENPPYPRRPQRVVRTRRGYSGEFYDED